jgi:hypothetical protein
LTISSYIFSLQTPDPNEFELIVNTVEDLEELIKKFDPEAVEPTAQPTIRTNSRQKVHILE